MTNSKEKQWWSPGLRICLHVRPSAVHFCLDTVHFCNLNLTYKPLLLSPASTNVSYV
jgi:hypothetical protein